jgi:hypothetical protein
MCPRVRMAPVLATTGTRTKFATRRQRLVDVSILAMLTPMPRRFVLRPSIHREADRRLVHEWERQDGPNGQSR